MEWEERAIVGIAFLIGALTTVGTFPSGQPVTKEGVLKATLGGLIAITVVVLAFKAYARLRWALKDPPEWMGHRGSKKMGYQQAMEFTPAKSHKGTHYKGYEIQKDKHGREYYEHQKMVGSGPEMMTKKWLTPSGGWLTLNWPYVPIKTLQRRMGYKALESTYWREGYVPAPPAAAMA